MMKKILSVLSAVVMLLTFKVQAAPESKIILRLQGLEIMQGDENGMRLEDNITRAEFAAVICRMMGLNDVSGLKCDFTDVPEEHWAAGYIEAAHSAAITEGVGNNMFAPEDNITYNQVCKMIVSLLGYGAAAENLGGWPVGYIAEAGIIHLTKGVDISGENAVRGEVAAMLYNALDIELMKPEYGKKDSYIGSGETLYEYLTKIKSSVSFKGILQETEISSVTQSTPSVNEGFVVVDGTEYKVNDSIDGYLGQYVEGYATERNDGVKEIVSVSASSLRNKIYSFNSEDCTLTEGYALCCRDDGSSIKKTISSEAVYLYNGRVTSNYKSYFSIKNGKYTLLDNDGDDRIDVVFINEYISLIIDKVNTENSSVFFAKNELFKGRKGFDLLNNDEKIVDLRGADGKKIEINDIKKGDGITIEADEDMSLAKVYISSETISGKVSSVDSDGNVEIDGKNYTSFEKLSIGDEGVFALDVYGNIIGISGEKKTKLTYGYVAGAERTKGILGNLELLIISGGKPEKNVKVKDGTETISYYFQNNENIKYICEQKIAYAVDDTKGTGASINTSEIDPSELLGKVIGYTIGSNGKITALNVYTVPAVLSKCTFNAKILAFGGETSDRGYCADSNTSIICIPSNVKSIDDYGVRVYAKDKSTYTVYGINGISDYEPGSERYSAEEVDVIILKTDMDSSQPLPIQPDSDICIVGKVSTVSNAEGEITRKIELLNKNERVTKETDSSGTAYETAGKLRMGDLVRYVENSDGTIANIKKLASVQGLKEYTQVGNYYGVCEDITYSSYDYLSNDYVDIIEISFGNGFDNKRIKIMSNESQPIYLYDRTRGFIREAATDDLYTAQQSINNASKIFALIGDNDAEAIVIIKD